MTRVSAIIVKGGNVLLIHRKKKEREYWVFPGGRVEKGETFEEAIIREVKEETNLDVTKVTYGFDYKNKKGIHPIFYCEANEGELILGGPEVERVKKGNWYHPEWVSLKRLSKINLYPKEGIRALKKLQ